MENKFVNSEGLVENLGIFLSIITLILLGWFHGWWILLAFVVFFPMTVVYMLILIYGSELIVYLWNHKKKESL